MATTAQLSQLIAEVLRTGTAVPAQLTQIALELLRANGTETPIPTGTVQPIISIIT